MLSKEEIEKAKRIKKVNENMKHLQGCKCK